jgi:osmotically-inducible protein OsmY
MSSDSHAALPSDLIRRASRALSEEMSLPLRITQSGDSLVLTGEADSDAAKAEAEATVQEIFPGVKVVNRLTVNEHLRPPRDAYVDHDRPSDHRRPRGSESLEMAEGHELDYGFDDQPLETNPINVADESVYDLDAPAEPDATYFAPTDPVMGTDDQGGPEILGGFEPSSTSDVDEVDRSTLDWKLGDEAIADAVRRELREDAETTGLSLTVHVVNGVVRLRGRVADLTDAEDAEEVAGRVPGVREVIDETTVVGS